MMLKDKICNQHTNA